MGSMRRAIVLNPNKPFQKSYYVVNPENIDAANEKINPPDGVDGLGQTVCFQKKSIIPNPKLPKENGGRLNGRFFELEFDKPFDREFALFFNLCSYRVDIYGEKTYWSHNA